MQSDAYQAYPMPLLGPTHLAFHTEGIDDNGDVDETLDNVSWTRFNDAITSPFIASPIGDVTRGRKRSRSTTLIILQLY